MLRPALLAFLALLPFSAAALAQTPEAKPINVTIIDVDDSDFPEVRAVVTVDDADGNPIEFLSRRSFLAEETGETADIVELQGELAEGVGESAGVGIVLTLDTSGSMSGPIGQAKASAASFVADLSAADEVAVISFADQVRVLAPASVDHESALAAINGLTAVGSTALYGAVQESLNVALSIDLPRRAIVLLSDGLDFGGLSGSTREQSLSLAAGAGVPIYVIALGTEVDLAYLQTLADSTGGAVLETLTADGISEVYEQLALLVRRQYVLTLRSGADAAIAERSITVTVSTTSDLGEGHLEYTSLRDIVAAPPAPAAPGAPAAVPAPAASGGSNLALFTFLAALGAAAGLVVARFLLLRWRARRVARDIARLSRQAQTDLSPATPVPSKPGAKATVLIEGPGFRRNHEIGAEPVTLGSDPQCEVSLTDASGAVGGRHARLWQRDGRLVFHQLSEGHSSMLNGEGVRWVSLSVGDQVQIGPYTLRVAPPALEAVP